MEISTVSEDKILPILHIREKSGPRQQPRLVRKGITVAFLATLAENPDWPIDRICDEYGLTRGEVYAAWSYYFDHQPEIEFIEENESFQGGITAKEFVARKPKEKKTD
jgi:uncharacterized protein (DUF433 family)